MVSKITLHTGHTHTHAVGGNSLGTVWAAVVRSSVYKMYALEIIHENPQLSMLCILHIASQKKKRFFFHMIYNWRSKQLFANRQLFTIKQLCWHIFQDINTSKIPWFFLVYILERLMCVDGDGWWLAVVDISWMVELLTRLATFRYRWWS